MKILFDEIGNDWGVVAEIRNVPKEVIIELVDVLNEALLTAGYLYSTVKIVE
jgi:hypothetical protein